MAEVRTRREPPPFRPVTVARAEQRTPTLVQVTLSGEALDGFDPGLPAASVRLLLPRPDTGKIEIPGWTGNEFLWADGSRPRIRTLTPLGFDPVARELEVQIVLHGDSPLTQWARSAMSGGLDAASDSTEQADISGTSTGEVENSGASTGGGVATAVSGTGRGYEVDEQAGAFVVVGDEAALPAITTVLPALPASAAIHVIVEVRDLGSRIELPAPEHAVVTWCELGADDRPGDAMVAAVTGLDLPDDVRVWAAGEAAGVQRIRKHLFDEVGLARRHATVRGYWKVGRAEGGT